MRLKLDIDDFFNRQIIDRRDIALNQFGAQLFRNGIWFMYIFVVPNTCIIVEVTWCD